MAGGKPINVPPFRATKDETVGVVQRDSREAFRQIAATPIVAGKLVTVTLDSTKTTNVAHGLGRRYQGWLLVDITAAGDVYRDGTANVDTATYVPLKVSAGTPTVTLWIF